MSNKANTNTYKFQLTLPPLPCSWLVWEPAAHRQTLHIDMSAYPDYAAMHACMCRLDAAYTTMQLHVTNGVSGGIAVFDWSAKSIPSERYGVRHMFYSPRLDMEIAVYPDRRWMDELRMIMKLEPN